MGNKQQPQPDTDIEVPGSYHRYYGDDHYGDRAEGGSRIPDEMWRVLRIWDGGRAPEVVRPRRRGPLLFAATAAGIVAAALYGIFG